MYIDQVVLSECRKLPGMLRNKNWACCSETTYDYVYTGINLTENKKVTATE